jgi:hypothetical protein
MCAMVDPTIHDTTEEAEPIDLRRSSRGACDSSEMAPADDGRERTCFIKEQ